MTQTELYRMRAKIYSVISLAFFVPTFFFLLMGLRDTSKFFDSLTTVKIIVLVLFAVLGIIFFLLSIHNDNLEYSLKQQIKEEKRKRAIQDVIYSIRSGNTELALETFEEFINNYSKPQKNDGNNK